ncbi:28S ribosomal protein S28, mitochondrial [Agrilus planipennis]|uniref:28S ribosomal protein S28, mitochondrial n=1 Tax=Agrilus planipennis TaxID=224129 RepID=A0A1W4WTA4_AGRPL|nr:28S ribosomal protein S28, mitochondrial [Agrilus planipennis]
MSMLKHYRLFFNVRPVLHCNYLSQTADDKKDRIGGYAKAFEKFEQNIRKPSNQQEKMTFSALLRNSKFIDLGDPEGKIAQGKIFHVVEDDLYIDFGWKFHCVCPRPKKQAEKYIRGAKVKILIKDLELSSRFLGYKKDLTLLEADCHLIGLIESKHQDKHQSSN